MKIYSKNSKVKLEVFLNSQRKLFVEASKIDCIYEDKKKTVFVIQGKEYSTVEIYDEVINLVLKHI